MRRLRSVRSLVVFACVAVVAGGLGLSSVAGAPTPSGPQQVLVVNPLTQPVPVRGTIGIDPTNNTVAVSSLPLVKFDETANAVKLDPANNGVTVSNTPNVSVTNSPIVRLDASANEVRIDDSANTVKIDNSATTPLYVKDVSQIRTPAQTERSLTLSDGEGDVSVGVVPPGANSMQVPVGKTLVVTSVSLIANVPSDQRLYETNLLWYSPSSPYITSRLSLTGGDCEPIAAGWNRVAKSFSGEWYVPEGSSLTFDVRRSATAWDVTMELSVNGYLVDAP